MNNDLISREALKENEPHYDEEGYRIFYESEIDNAPTVDTTCPHCDSGYAQGYSDGYLRGKEERPQGEWIEIPVKRDLLYNTGIKYTCSICGSGNCYGKPPFCMYCGAKMKGGAE